MRDANGGGEPPPPHSEPSGAGMPPAEFPHLRQAGRIGSLDLPHRLMMGSMHLGLEGPGADVDRLCRFYTDRVAGGAALIVTGGIAVSPEGAGEGGAYFHFGRGKDEEALERIAAAVRRAGGRVAAQLFHAGRYARSAEIGAQPVAPSAVASRLNPRDPPRALGADELPALAERFAAAAARARDLGFHAVELMGSEGYLLNEFLAPATNRREDGWGGSAEGRRRFPVLVARRTVEAAGPGCPVLYRISGADLVEGGTPWEDTLAFAAALEELEGLARRERTALLCAEAVPWRCHRSLIADALTVRGWRVVHILSEGHYQEHHLTPFARVDGRRLTYPSGKER